MVLMALVTMTFAASEVALTVDPATPCVQKPALVQALLARGLRFRPRADVLEVHVTPAPGGLELVGRLHERRFQRLVPTEGSPCITVERVVANLIESWANTPQRTPTPRAAESAADGGALVAEAPRVDAGVLREAPPAVRTGEATVTPLRGEDALSVRDGGAGAELAARSETTPSASDGAALELAARTGPTPSAGKGAVLGPAARSEQAPPAGGDVERSAAIDAGASPGPEAGGPGVSGARLDSSEREAQSARSPPEGNEAASSEVPPSSPDAVALPPVVSATDGGVAAVMPFNLEVGVLGGGTIDGAGLATGAGSALLRAGIGRFGLLLDVGFESARSASVGRVKVFAPQQWLSAALSVAFTPLDALRLDLALGARGWRTDASAEGLDERTGEGLQLTIGGVVSAGAAWRVTGPLFLTARAFASVRSVELKLKVEPYGDVLSLNPWIYGLQGGVLVRFE